MNRAKYFVLWLSIFFVPNWGNAFSTTSSKTFFTKKIKTLTSYVQQQLRDEDKTLSMAELSSFSFAATDEELSTGAYIINMGVQPQTEENGLKPYGLIWTLLDNQVPVKWVIRPGKAKDEADFTYNRVDFSGGPFIIPAEYRTPAINSIINFWEGEGVVGVTTTAPITVPVERTLNHSLIWALDDKNGKIAEAYFEAANMPIAAYSNSVEPQNLDCCTDIYVIPHADPDWDTHEFLLNWNDRIENGGCQGAIWAGCQAVSNVENLVNPGNNSERLNFLMNNPILPSGNPAVDHGDHDDGNEPYLYDHHDHPIMQFMGLTDGAQEGGSEQIYLPTNGWRPSTLIGVWDNNHEDVPSLSTGPAAKIVFGPAFGDNNRGQILYEGGHKLDGSDPENIAAMRAFFNFSLMAAGEKAIKVNANVPQVMNSQQTYNLNGLAMGGTGNYTYQWTASCGGTFSNANAVSTDFTPINVTAETACILKLTVTDDCGSRFGFYSQRMVIRPDTGLIAPSNWTISGKVYADTNEDGVDNDGVGNGVSGVSVYMYDDMNQDGIVDGGDTLIGTTSTNLDGQFNYEMDASEEIIIATDDFSDATWNGTTWGGGVGWSGGWNDRYGERVADLGPNLGTNGGDSWNVGIINCNQTNNHNNCEPFGTAKLSLENGDYVSRPINLLGYNSVEFSFTLETAVNSGGGGSDSGNSSGNNSSNDVLTVKICTNIVENDCYTLYTNGVNNDNFAETPTLVNASLTNPSYLIADAHLFFYIEGFNGNAEYLYVDEIVLTGTRDSTHIVITTDTNSIASNNYYTTDNLETAVFGATGGNDANNNFGISAGTRIENTTWLDLNGNGLEDPLETDIANMGVCISNQLPLLINGQNIPVGNYNDTVYTDVSGNYVFENLPDCDWQLIAHYDPTLYRPTYDADGGILNSTTFSLRNGQINAANNSWCENIDCLDELDFGFSLAGDFNLSGTICIDDGSKDGICSTGGESFFDPLDVLLYDDEGTFFGGVTSNNNSFYSFPFLLEKTYIVSLNTEQMSLDTFLFTTKKGATPAEEILKSSQVILQKVPVLQDVYGVDFAFIPHSANQPTVMAHQDEFTLCPGLKYENWVGKNDTVTSANFVYSLVEEPTDGVVFMEKEGAFAYTSVNYTCGKDEFRYQVCDLTGICDTAMVTLIFEDEKAPNLVNVPRDIVISGDENIPAPALVSAFDNCPRIGINLTEVSTQGEDGCSQYDYELTRTWTATDLCGNAKSGTQFITVEDVVAPDIFRIYTLPNGKKMVAGVAEFTNENWKTVLFPINFETTPLVFTQLITHKGNSLAIPQIRATSTAQFELHIQAEEANDEVITRESVAWIAIESGAQSESYNFLAESIMGNDAEENIEFTNQFDTTPIVFSNIQSTFEKDPALVTLKNTSKNGTTLKLTEETSKDAETEHFPEEVALLAIENIGNITNENGQIIGEIGKATVNNFQQTIELQHVYHNPVIITAKLNGEENEWAMIRINKRTATSFEAQLQTWDYFQQLPENMEIAYMVIEGSLPLYVPDFCEEGRKDLIIGEDIKAIDNCDNSVDLTYTESKRFDGAVQIIDRHWRSSDECGNEVAYTQQVTCEGIAVSVQTLLQGALIGAENENLMRDDLRKKGLIPLIEPYSALPAFQHAGKGGGEQIKPDLLQIEGENAIVDWVLVEIRSAEDLQELVATSAGLVQRDGDVISADGDSLIVFENVPYGAYHVAVRHRNHIGMLTKAPQIFGFNQVPKLDFRNIFTPTDGNRPGIKVGNKNAQWSGDLNGDGKTIYQGPQNDPFEMFLHIILDEGNQKFLVNYINHGYTEKDFNLDGSVIFQGPNNDKSNLLFNTILAHPDNEKFLANFVVVVGNR